MKTLVSILSYLVGGVFILAGSIKIINLPNFIKTISQLTLFNFIPKDGLTFLSITLIISELLIGIMLIINQFRSLGAVLSCALLTFFILLTVFVIFKGQHLKCGCFGPWSQTFSPKLLAQDIILLIFSLTILVSTSQRRAP